MEIFITLVHGNAFRQHLSGLNRITDTRPRYMFRENIRNHLDLVKT